MTANQIALRPARAEDINFCEELYFAGMERIIRELKLDMAAQAASFHKQWELSQVRIIVFDGTDIGWLQTAKREDSLFITQLFVDGPFQRRGIGTEVVHRVIREAAHARLAVTLDVVKINPALTLYERLGFRVTGGEERKFYMRRDPDPEPPASP
jgi:GNAT superfamily N-acetyltransferase